MDPSRARFLTSIAIALLGALGLSSIASAASGTWERSWGKDMIQSGQPGDTGTGFEVCANAAHCQPGDHASTGLGGELLDPVGLAYDPDGNLYVSESSGAHRIEKFDAAVISSPRGAKTWSNRASRGTPAPDTRSAPRRQTARPGFSEGSEGSSVSLADSRRTRVATCSRGVTLTIGSTASPTAARPRPSIPTAMASPTGRTLSDADWARLEQRMSGRRWRRAHRQAGRRAQEVQEEEVEEGMREA
jgi:NHL repeat